MISAGHWTPADDLGLEPSALRAAKEINRSLALTAGPGAGKTEMLAQRADFLLRTDTCPYPQRILAISFKVDASRNLKERVRRRCGAELSSRFDSYTFHAFAKRLIDRFRPVLTGLDALDPDFTIGDKRVAHVQITFGDMVPLAITILQKSAVARNAVRQTYSHVFLDEFQDCTKEQYALIQTAFLDTDTLLTAVGDTKQRIMGWAGAMEGIFEQFSKDFGAIPLNLYQNFRSLPRLRRMQNDMVKVMDPPAALEDKDLPGDDGEINIWQFDNGEAEAEELANSIDDWITLDGVPPSQIAVLVRQQIDAYGEHLVEAFRQRGIPFRNENDIQDLATEPVARLILDFLAVVTADTEPDAYERLMTMVTDFGLEDEDAYRQRADWNGYLEEVRNRAASGKVDTSDGDAVATVIQEMLSRVGRDKIVALSGEYESGPFLDDLTVKVIDRLKASLASAPDLNATLAHFSDDNAVRLLTIHKSKGLEFDTVVCLGVEKECFWGKLPEMRSEFFVAISRAKRRLILTTADERVRPETPVKYWADQRTPFDEFIAYAQLRA